jgi:hypothetical protein
MNRWQIILLAPLAIAAAQPDTLWTRTYDIGQYEYCSSLVADEDGSSVIAGSCRPNGPSDVYVMKVDSDGDVLWSLIYGSPDHSEIGTAVISTSDGGYAVSGYTSDTGKGYYDFLLLKLDSDGSLQWTSKYGTAGMDMSPDIVQTGDGGYLLGGYIQNADNYTLVVKVDCLGEQQWMYQAEQSGTCESILRQGDGFLLGGWSGYQDSLCYYQTRLINSAGESVGVFRFKEGVPNGFAWDMCRSDQGGFVLAGQSFDSNGSQGYLLCSDETGTQQWTCVLGGPNDDEFNAVARTLYSGYIAVGRKETSPDESDFWVVKLDTFGNAVWEQTWDIDSDALYAVAQTPDGGYILGGKAYSAATGSDIVLIRLMPPAGIEPQEKADSFTLVQNPADQAPGFSFFLEQSNTVQLRIYDTSGRIVDTLYTGLLQQGAHTIFSSELPVGVYTARLQCGNQNSSVRFTVLN